MKEINIVSSRDFYYRRNNYRKLTLGEGEKFIAKIAKVDFDNRTITLRTPQGYEVECAIEENVDLDAMENKVAKFRVKDVNEGKITVSILENLKEDYSLEDSIEDLLSKFNSKDKDIKDIIKLMLKFNIDINKENISQLKALIDFKEKLMSKEYDLNQLIKNIIDKNKIDIQTPKGTEILNKLTNFFNELKEVDLKTIFVMKENSIPFTGENIASLKNINMNNVSIDSVLKDLNLILHQDSEIGILNERDMDNTDIWKDTFKKDQVFNDKNNNNENIITKGRDKEIGLKQNEIAVNSKEFDKITLKGITVDSGVNISHKQVTREENDLDGQKSNMRAGNKIEESIKNTTLDNEKNSSMTSEEVDEINKESIIKGSIEEKILLNKDVTIKSVVLKELKENIENMKEPLQKLLENKDNISKEILNKVSVFLDSHINDIKVYNSLNNNYYYLDSPIKYNNEEYPCKLIIKDERKKDKKIDKSNIKIAISLKTKKIGVIDSFIKVNYNNVNVEFQCEDKYYSLLNKNKQGLIDRLSKNNYFVSINIKKKVKEFGIIECIDFFQDLNTAAVNVKV